MIKRARMLRNTMSDAERRLWAEIRRDRLGVRFRRQVVFDQRYILDFYAPAIRLAVEVDGSQHIGRSDEDARRTAYLVQRGVSVLRFWNTEVLLDTAAVVDALADLVGELGPASPLTPLPRGGGERFAHLKLDIAVRD